MTPTKSTTPVTALVVGVAAMFCFTIAGVVVIAIAVPEGGNPGSLIALLLGSLAPTIAAVVGLAKIGSVQDKVDDLANGKMDSKIRAAVADVIGPDQVHEDIRSQVAADRIRREEH